MSDNAPKVLLRSEESAGQVAVVELAGGGRPPLHHHDFDETFYVLEGELSFQLEDDVFTRRAGELAFAPRGVPHTYANRKRRSRSPRSSRSARHLEASRRDRMYPPARSS